LVSTVWQLFERSVWFQMTTAMLFEWAERARMWSLQDDWNSSGSCLGEYSQTLIEMGCNYIEHMLIHCGEGE
jgi:hypothetical protein